MAGSHQLMSLLFDTLVACFRLQSSPHPCPRRQLLYSLDTKMIERHRHRPGARLNRVKRDDCRGLKMMMEMVGVSRRGCCLRRGRRRLGGFLFDWWWLTAVSARII